MNFIREVIDSDALENIVPVPDELKHQKVEILVLPLKSYTGKTQRPFNPNDFIGILHLNNPGNDIKALRDEWDRR